MQHVIAVDVGGTTIKAGIVNRDGDVRGYHQKPTLKGETIPDPIVSRIKDSIQELLDSFQDIKIEAIGIGIPGAISSPEGLLMDLLNIPVLNGYPLLRELENEFGLPISIDNSANNAARGEYMFGVAKGRRNFVLVTLGTGVGGGLFVDGKLCRGTSNYAGEVGHMKLVPEGGRRCGCGGFGCWEAYGSATALVARAKALIENGCRSSLEEYYPDNLNPKVIVTEAQRGDSIATFVFDELCRFNAIGLANLINILSPSLCIISGGLSQCGDFLLANLRNKIQIHAMPRAWGSVEITLGQLGGQAGQKGAAALAFLNIR